MLGDSDLSNVTLIGDRVLIQPKADSDKTRGGIYLPPGLKEKEKIQSGYVVLVGPGYAVGSDELDPDWKYKGDKARYIPLQVQVGDLAIFLLSAAYEIRLRQQKYFVVPHASVLMVERDEALFD